MKSTVNNWLKRITLTGLLLVSLFAHAAEVPVLERHVTDLTQTLTTAQIEQLDKKLSTLEQEKGAQLVVLIVPTTAPQDIESYSLAVAETNKIGRSGTDDGILFIIAKEDRRNRIEVGYGLEGAVTDVNAARILREYVAPHFKQGDFFTGIDTGVDQLIKLINGEALPAPSQKNKGEGFIKVLAFFFTLFPIFVVRHIVCAILGKERNKVLKTRLLLGAVLSPIIPLVFIINITGSISGYIIILLLYAVAGALIFAIPPRLTSGIAATISRHSSNGSSFRSGSSGSRGGFSGGGGRFGGGGSSGSW